jgi:hypothetical protein
VEAFPETATTAVNDLVPPLGTAASVGVMVTERTFGEGLDGLDGLVHPIKNGIINTRMKNSEKKRVFFTILFPLA